MNVLFISHRPPFPPNKGEKIRTFNQLKYLKELGHNISVCSPVSTDEDIQHMKTLGEDYCETVFYGKAAGKRGYLTALLSNQALSIAYFYSADLQQQLDDYLQTHRVHAIICSSSSMADYVFRSGMLSQLTTRPRLIMDFMDLDSDKWHQYESIKPFPVNMIYGRECNLLQVYEQRVHKQFDACLFVSEQEAELFTLQLDTADKIHGISNGLDTQFFQPGAFRDELQDPVFLFTGAMDYFPNTDAVNWFVKHCWDTIRQHYPNAHFYIAGMNPTSKIKALDKRPGITVTGFVEDIRKYYHRADIFVAPMQVARGLQNKVLEAFATGVPVVTSSRGAESIHCEHGNQLLIADTPTDFSKHVHYLIKNTSLRRKLRDNALNLISTQYSWAGCLSSFESIVFSGTLESGKVAGGLH